MEIKKNRKVQRANRNLKQQQIKSKSNHRVTKVRFNDRKMGPKRVIDRSKQKDHEKSNNQDKNKQAGRPKKKAPEPGEGSSQGEDDGEDDMTGSDVETAKNDKAAKMDRKEQRKKRKFDFERNCRTIFVGNLPTDLDHKDVAKLFKKCGHVESARIRSVIPDKEKLPPKVAKITGRIHPKVDSVNAYVVFGKNDEVDTTIKKALAMNGQLINGHHIRVDIAQHPNSKRMTLTSRKKSVFVGNLRFDIRDDDLISHFEKVGKVDFVRLVRDRATGLGKGFGFVKFAERASVKEALKLNDTEFKGRALRLKKVE